MKPTQRIKQSISLIFSALIIGLIWRLEVEYQGWAGLIWLSYFHWAIPIGFILFLVWANMQFRMQLNKRIVLNFSATIYGILLYFGLSITLSFYFIGGPTGILLNSQIPEWLSYALQWAFFPLILLHPIGAYLLLKLFNKTPTPKYLLCSIVGFILSVPLAVLVLELVQHKGGQDIIHTLKSGVLIPFWVFSFGTLLLGQKETSF